MKTLYLDCGMGAAGDMLAAALWELLPDQEQAIGQLNAAGIPHVHFAAVQSVKCGVTGTHMEVAVHGHEEHEHGHHHHSGVQDVRHIVAHLNLPDDVRKDVLSVYDLIAAAESRVHGVPVTDIHFHEVGTLDAIADITAVCLLLRRLAPDRIVASPVCVGFGAVRCAHGTLPVPAPATAQLLKGVPVYSGGIEGELCTPTGAALLKHFVSRFGEMPVMRVDKIGYGMGSKDFERANCVRALWGADGDSRDSVVELSCNVDDMTAEAIGFATEQLLAGGALDVYTIPIGMKKSRPGTKICVLCDGREKEKIVELVFRYTTTIGIRESVMRRYVLDRKTETVRTAYGDITVKTAYGYGVRRRKAEYDGVSAIARAQNVSLEEIKKAAEESE